MRNSWSVPAVLVAVVGLTGCYDLSAPSGPQRDDFLQNRNGTPSQDQGQTQGDPRHGATATAVDHSASTTDAIDAIDGELEAAALADEFVVQKLLAADTAK